MLNVNDLIFHRSTIQYNNLFACIRSNSIAIYTTRTKCTRSCSLPESNMSNHEFDEKEKNYK